MEPQQIEITLWKEISAHQVFIRLTDDLLSVSWWVELVMGTLDAWKLELPSPLAFLKAFALGGQLCLSSLNLTLFAH